MEWFATTREAKEYLIDRIVAQARHDGVLLTDIEQQMLYFTEGKGWTLPDMMQVNSEFDRNYDQDAYDSKIGQIIRRIHDQPIQTAMMNGGSKRCNFSAKKTIISRC